MSKSLGLVIQGLILLGDGLKGIAAELEEGGEKVAVAQKKSEIRDCLKKFRIAEAAPEIDEAALKETKAEAEAEAAPEIDEAALREECKQLVTKAAAAQKKPEILDCFKKFKIAKISECPADQLMQLKIDLGLIKV
jgi:ribosomal protein S20